MSVLDLDVDGGIPRQPGAEDGPRLTPIEPRGRSPKLVLTEVLRALEPQDLVLLQQDRGVKTPPIKDLRDAHHKIARLVAEGEKTSEIAVATGYSQARISTLKSDPTFAELVEHYRGQVAQERSDAYAEGLAKMIAVRDLAAELILERMLDRPETFTHGDLLDNHRAMADRTGLGPQSKSTSVNVNYSYAESVARGRARAERSWVEPEGEDQGPPTISHNRYDYTANEPSHRVEGGERED